MKYIYDRGRLTIRWYPIVAWVFGVLFALALPLAALADSWIKCLSLLGIGLIVGIGLSPVTTIIADKARATLTIELRYLFVPVRRAYPFAEIADVQLATAFPSFQVRSKWERRRRRGQIFDYRVVVVLTSGQVISLPLIYTWNYLDHVKLAQRLGDFIKVPRG